MIDNKIPLKYRATVHSVFLGILGVQDRLTQHTCEAVSGQQEIHYSVVGVCFDAMPLPYGPV